jgi:hypothetical protein
MIGGHLGVEVAPLPGDLAALRALDPHVALHAPVTSRPAFSRGR